MTTVGHGTWWAETTKARHPEGQRVILAVVVAALIVWNLYWFGQIVEWVGLGLHENDWYWFTTLDPARAYETWFKWPPPMAYVIHGIAVAVPFGLWVLLHLTALLTIRDRRVVLLALVTFPFWMDVVEGNVLTFVFVAAWWALAGNRWGVVLFCVLAALIPRPLMVPVLAWLLWHRVDARWAFGVSAATVVAIALATGVLGPWLHLLVSASTSEMTQSWNVGPSAIIGAVWVPIGLVAGAILTWKGRLGLASLAVSPYVIHYYVIFALLPDQPVEQDRVAVKAGRREGLDAGQAPAQPTGIDDSPDGLVVGDGVAVRVALR